jgi:hypothetical protein
MGKIQDNGFKRRFAKAASAEPKRAFVLAAIASGNIPKACASAGVSRNSFCF